MYAVKTSIGCEGYEGTFAVCEDLDEAKAKLMECTGSYISEYTLGDPLDVWQGDVAICHLAFSGLGASRHDYIYGIKEGPV